MAYTFDGEIRVTHQYRDGYSELDEWIDAGFKVKVLGGARKIINDKHGENVTIIYHVRAPKNVRPELVRYVCNGQFATGCTCEHDCCGHWQSFLSAFKKIGRGKYVALVNWYVNV